MSEKELVLDPTLKFLETIQKLQAKYQIPVQMDDVIYSTTYRKTTNGYYRLSWLKATQMKELI